MHITKVLAVCALCVGCGGTEYIDFPDASPTSVQLGGDTSGSLDSTFDLYVPDADAGAAADTLAPDTAPAAPTYSCNADEMLFDGHCYSAPGVKWMDYATAAALCASRGADVAEITSDAENKFIYTLLQSIPVGGGQAAWIALKRTTAAHFQWASGKAANYVAWAPGEPNNESGSENCVVVWGHNLKVTELRGLWNDASCDDPGRDTVICERPAPQTP
ncbi:MAG: C-type lectin domain-containing protein [Myxococcales bacterium]|nr:C-type lectin domain-containing protein [Myxococcales bacterium]